MNKKGDMFGAIVVVVLTLLVVVFVVGWIIPYIKDLLGIGTSYASDFYDEEKSKEKIQSKDFSIDKIAEQDYSKLVDFIKSLNSQSFITQCKLIFTFDEKFPLNYFIFISKDGNVQLRSGEIDKVLKSDNINFIPYGDLSSEYNFNEYFKGYEKFKTPILITASGGFVPSLSEKPLIIQTKSIVAVSKDKKWFLTKPYAFVDNNNKFPDCYAIVTEG